MKDIKRELVDIRKILNLEDAIWQNLPDHLLLLAFLPAEGYNILPYQYIKLLEESSYVTSYEIYEFYGDAILQLIISKYLFDNTKIMYKSNGKPGIYSKYRMAIVNNINLYCMMNKKGLCQKIISQYTMTYKKCADVFEAILGILYYYLDTILERDDAFTIIYNWTIETWNIKQIVSNLLNSNSTGCLINNGWSDWSDWNECSTTCGTGTQNRTRKCLIPYNSRKKNPCYGAEEEIRKCDNNSGCEY